MYRAPTWALKLSKGSDLASVATRFLRGTLCRSRQRRLVRLGLRHLWVFQVSALRGA